MIWRKSVDIDADSPAPGARSLDGRGEWALAPARRAQDDDRDVVSGAAVAAVQSDPLHHRCDLGRAAAGA
jgi:hypothetical protein